MFLFPYQTTPLKAYNLTQIESELQKAMITGKLIEGVTRNGTRTAIKEVPPTDKFVPSFTNPVAIQGDRGYTWVIDSRPFCTVNRDGTFQVRDWQMHDLQLLRAQLSSIWADGEQSLFITLGDLAVQSFAIWLGEGITRKLYLDPSEDITVKICAAYYYFGLFQDNARDNFSVDTEQERDRVFVMIARAMRSSPESVREVIGEHPMPTDIYGFVKLVHQVVGNTRITQISAPLLYTILQSSWFSTADREMVCVAMEHPPTWAAMIFNALNEKLFTRTQLAKLVMKLDRNNSGKNFTRALMTLIGDAND